MAAPQDLSPGTERAGVAVRADLAASLPALGRLATEFLAGGTVLALIAFACIMVPVRLAATSRADGRPPGREP